MPETRIHVRYQNGTAAYDIPVILGFLNGGVTETVYTDRSGLAVINHALSGRAILYVGGRSLREIETPTSLTVTL